MKFLVMMNPQLINIVEHLEAVKLARPKLEKESEY